MEKIIHASDGTTAAMHETNGFVLRLRLGMVTSDCSFNGSFHMIHDHWGRAYASHISLPENYWAC